MGERVAGKGLIGKLTRSVPLLILFLGLAVRAADPPVVESLRNGAFDQFQRLEPRLYQPLPVKVVDVDEAALEAFGQWPWPRDLMAELIARLQEMGVAAIGLDMVFAEADRLSPRRLAERLESLPALRERLGGAVPLEELPDSDEILAATIAGGAVVAGVILGAGDNRPSVKAGFATAGDDPRLFVPAFTGAVSSLPVIVEAAAGNGALNVLRESGGTIRRVPMIFNAGGGELFPSLDLELLRVAQGASSYIVRSSGASGVTSFGEQTGVNAIKTGALEVPTDGEGQVWLYDSGPRAERSLSAREVLRPEGAAPDLLGHIVLIGSSAAGLRDQHATPLGHAVAGVTVHAQVLEQIIAQDFLARPDWAPGAEVLFILALCLLVYWAFLKRRLPPIALALAGSAGIVLAVGGTWALFSQFRLLIDPVTPALVCIAVYTSASLIQYLETDREKRQVRNAFSHYLEPQLVEILSNDPSALKLGGERKELTLLFCDLRGFTSLSEKLPVEETTEVINRFLTAMSEAILRNHGTIDKYMGDCVMAFWNAPLDDPLHARNACLAALDMRQAMAEVQRDYPDLRMGIGINSGPCSVGNMGSLDRFDYSAIGDNVNLASRLEGETKTYRLDIIVSEATREAVTDLPFLEVGDVIVRGRQEAVKIYTLPWGLTAGNAADFAPLVERHAALIDALGRNDAGEARALLGTLSGEEAYPDGLPWYLDLVLETPEGASKEG